MGETKPEKKGFRLKALLVWVGIWCVFGAALTVVLWKLGVKSYMATAWQAADFLILLTIIYFAAKDPVMEYLAGRKNEISSNIEVYKKQLEEMEKNYEEIKYRLTWIEEEVENIESRARSDAALEKMRLEEEAQKQIERIKNEAEFNMKQEIKAAEARLKEEAIARALKIAEEILKKKVTDKEEMKLLEEYLQEVQSGTSR
jgi:F-type H+-transporting ATPase subunit b